MVSRFFMVECLANYALSDVGGKDVLETDLHGDDFLPERIERPFDLLRRLI